MQAARKRFLISTAVVVLIILVPTAALATTILHLLPGTAVLLSKTGHGALSSTSSRTNTFSPAAFVDYKRFGGEPTVTVDRYPFPGTNTSQAAQCSAGVTTCYKDITYASSPNGFAYPHFSPFWKSDDLGQTFRVPCHTAPQGQTCATGGGGGDSHTVVGQKTHRLFFVDLPGPGCVTDNVSDDLGETFVGDNVGCGSSPGVIDDRQWVEADENFPGSKNVYISFINDSNLAAPTLSLARSLQDGNPGTFVTDSTCNTLNAQTPSGPIIDPLPTVGAGDSDPTACPDPADPSLQIAGPVVADNQGTSTRPPTHNLYIPFVRATTIVPGVSAGPPYTLYIAKSTDGATTWTRHKVADLGDHNPVNLFPELDVDRGGNIYLTWAQTQGPGQNDSGLLGETDVYYTFSTNGGLAWASPIDLTQSNGKSAVMPWLVAGDPGLVDIVYYQSNTGLNPNVATVDSNGNPCDPNNPDDTSCPNDNPSVWNVMFGQSNNALNSGSNFSNVQISDHPNHIGQICTAGLACSGDRDLLDFFTIDVDHLGAANVIWADDNTKRNTDTRNKFSRQISGSSVYKNTSIGLAKTWPIKDHEVTDRAGDTYNSDGVANGACPSMDVLGSTASRSGDQITIGMTLNSAPTAAKATSCSITPAAPSFPATGGIWGAEFWAATSDGGSNSFYIAFRDNPGDGSPRVEGGVVDNTNNAVTSLEFRPVVFGAGLLPSGTCTFHPAPSPCTISMTISASALGIKSGAGLYSITGLSLYFNGTTTVAPGTRVEAGDSEQADATAPFDITGTGTTN